MSLLPDWNLKDIFQSWLTSLNPTEQEVDTAHHRAAICFACPALKEKAGIPVCGECGCFIKAKVFSKRGPVACPLKKWDK
jgi:hypothetical protein